MHHILASVLIHIAQLSRAVSLGPEQTDWKSSPHLMIYSIRFLTIERDRRSLVATTAWNKYFKEWRCTSEPHRYQCMYCLCWQGAGQGGIAADHTEDELQICTCRTRRTDVHNVAVGHKNAIKLLFGFGVACKIDSSVGGGKGGEEKRKAM